MERLVSSCTEGTPRVELSQIAESLKKHGRELVCIEPSTVLTRESKELTLWAKGLVHIFLLDFNPHNNFVRYVMLSLLLTT